MTAPSPNALLPCGTPSARRRHLAKGAICSVCFPHWERPAVCPVCFERVTAVADRVLPHDTEGVEGFACPGSGAAVAPLVPLERGIEYRRRLRLAGAA